MAGPGADPAAAPGPDPAAPERAVPPDRAFVTGPDHPVPPDRATPPDHAAAVPHAPLPALGASVIILSRGRPEALVRCLRGVALLDHPVFEVVVVADPPGLAALHGAGFGARVKAVAFDIPNISAARNAGIAQAAGAVAAFLDDDAVPEPTWLARLLAPFADPRVAAAGGRLRGRNGFSIPWPPAEVDRLARRRPLPAPGDAPSLWQGEPGRGITTEGTNMALRLSVLRALGGFDPAFRFYLDETDLNLRLAAAGAVTAIVPGAEVHHGFLPSDRRRADRVPTTLHEIGASTVVFLRRHAPAGEAEGALAALRAEQRARLLRHMVAGRIEPREVGRLMATLEAGIEEGAARPLGPLAPLEADPPPFLPFPGAGPRPGLLLAGRPWSARGLARAARAAAEEGRIVTVLLMDPTPRRHRLHFLPEGWWLQTGGLFGASARGEGEAGGAPRLRLQGFSARVRAEAARLAGVRPLGPEPPPPPAPAPPTLRRLPPRGG